MQHSDLQGSISILFVWVCEREGAMSPLPPGYAYKTRSRFFWVENKCYDFSCVTIRHCYDTCMARPKRYANEAEKQRAYRERKKGLGLEGKEAVADHRDNLGKDVDEGGIPGGGVPASSVTYRDECGVERFRMNQGNVKGDYSFPEIAPKGIPQREWDYAIERAKRAKRYANNMPGFVGPNDVRSQDPLWQWENDVRGRFGGIIGGSLSGTRSEREGN